MFSPYDRNDSSRVVIPLTSGTSQIAKKMAIVHRQISNLYQSLPPSSLIGLIFCRNKKALVSSWPFWSANSHQVNYFGLDRTQRFRRFLRVRSKSALQIEHATAKMCCFCDRKWLFSRGLGSGICTLPMGWVCCVVAWRQQLVLVVALCSLASRFP